MKRKKIMLAGLAVLLAAGILALVFVFASGGGSPASGEASASESPGETSSTESAADSGLTDDSGGEGESSSSGESSDEKDISGEDESSDPGEESIPFSPAEGVAVARRPDRSEALTYHDFYQAGFACEVVYEPSDAYAYGQVISVEFTGAQDDSFYYVKPGTSVRLHVSSAQGEEAASYNDRIVYLTFDDGPSAHTPELLEILAAYNVKTTFFTVGTFVKTYPSHIRAVYEEGHALACHSFSHRYEECYASPEAMESDIHRWEDVVSQALGTSLPYRLYRYPGGSTARALPKEQAPAIKEKIASMGYYSYDWTCANCDKWLSPKKEDQTDREYFESQVKATVTRLESAHPNRPRIMLLHETVEETRNMMPWIIEYLSAKGYTFRTLDRLQESYYF